MSESEVSKLYGELREVKAKIDHLTELFNQAAHGDGFARCTRHSARLKQVENNVELAHARISGVKRWVISGLIFVASTAANYAWEMVKAAAHK